MTASCWRRAAMTGSREMYSSLYAVLKMHLSNGWREALLSVLPRRLREGVCKRPRLN